MTGSLTLRLTMAVFALQPIALGAWFALIPYVKDRLSLDKATLSIALLGMALALIPTLQVASRVLERFGPRRVLAVSMVAQAFAFLLPLFAGSATQLFFALAVNGAIMAFSQVSLNVYAGRLEKSADVVVMSRCHGCWALGLMVGSLAMTVLAGMTPVVALVLVAVPSSMLGSWVALRLPRLAGGDRAEATPKRRLRDVPPALYYIATFAMVIGMTEGAMNDWSAVYLAERLPEGAGYAGIAVSIYAGFLAGGRFLGDAAKVRFGAVVLARASLICAIVGLALLVVPLPLVLAYPGFALVGLGAAVGFPLGVSAVAALDDTYEAANIALMSMLSIAGFLIGPPMIGFLGDAFGLRAGLGALIPLLALALVFAGWLRPGIAVESASRAG